MGDSKREHLRAIMSRLEPGLSESEAGELRSGLEGMADRKLLLLECALGQYYARLTRPGGHEGGSRARA